MTSSSRDHAQSAGDGDGSLPVPPHKATLSHVYRVQDIQGRGPYQPGLSVYWSDLNGPLVAPWWEEIGMEMRAAHAQMDDPAIHWGCGFRSLAQLMFWFSPKERSSLALIGFYVVQARVDRLIVETPTQVVFGSRSRFADAPVFSLLTNPANPWALSGGMGRDPCPSQTADDVSGMNKTPSPTTPSEGE